MTDQPVDARSLRVSDAERRHVVELLERATGAGLIDLDEFSDRVDTALAARTRAELNRVLLDLPGLTHPDRHAAVPAATPPVRHTAPAPVTDRGGAEVRSVLSSVSRRGVWEVPPRLAVQAAMGSVELDLTEAHIAHERVEIALDVLAGSVELRVPPGTRVERGDLRVILGSIDDRRRGTSEAGGPTVVLTGAVRAGSVEIRPPRRSRWWARRR